MSNHGFIRVATACPKVYVADPERNAREIMKLAGRAQASGADLLVFPELSLTGYTCGDLFHQRHLQKAAMEALSHFLNGADRDLISVVGMPLRVDDQLFNCALVCAQGKVLAVVPKTYLPGYKEFYEPRHFAPASRLRSREIDICGSRTPIGTDILIEIENFFDCKIGVEICEDLWMPIPPSSHAALAGATLLVNPSASHDLVAKADYRRELVTNQSARCVAAYVYVSCGVYESSSDVVFGGHAMIAENGSILKEGERFRREESLTIADIDVERLSRERTMTGSFGQAIGAEIREYRKIIAPLALRAASNLLRPVDPYPFVPRDPKTRDARCEEVFSIQTAGLLRRLEHVANETGKKQVAIGVSGGLDSTLALLTIVRAFDLLGWERSGIIAVTMPGFGTTDRTKNNAKELCRVLGLDVREIPIRDAVLQHLKDIGHEPDLHCLTCQNAQARERTQILIDLGFVVGTGDLSEIALGWCTYNGDHMSMYNVNAGVPKTLVRHVVSYVVDRKLLGEEAAVVLKDIVLTPISPELEPPDEKGEITQKTEDLIGPYELHDFFLFHTLRNGYGPKKVLFLGEAAFGKKYERKAVVHWLRNFYKRFFGAQFKRNAAPDGPKVGSVALSQRGDWRMPSDVSARSWLAELDEISS